MHTSGSAPPDDPGSRTILFWPDAGRDVGSGHVMRCAAIAEAWMSGGGQAVFCCPPQGRGVPLPTASGLRVVELPGDLSVRGQVDAVLAESRRVNADWIVCDHYGPDNADLQRLARSGAPVALLDDGQRRTFDGVELVIRPHAPRPVGPDGGNLLDGPVPDRNWWLLEGLRFVPLRSGFRCQADQGRCPRRNSTGRDGDLRPRLLVTMGGSDPDNATGLVCRTLAASRLRERYELVVLIGPGYRHESVLRRELEAAGLASSLHGPVSDPAALFCSADVAISAGGSTLYEMACLGVPTLAIGIAENQRLVLEGLGAQGATRFLGWASDLTAESLRRELENLLDAPASLRSPVGNGRGAVDGGGAARIARRLAAGRLTLRGARESDCRALWELRNDPAVRAASLSPDEVPPDRHTKWLGSVLDDAHRQLLVIEDPSRRLVGQCRLDFDRVTGGITISVALAEHLRGCSVGGDLVRRALASGQRRWPARWARADIRRDNEASRSLFRQLGFRCGRGTMQETGEVEVWEARLSSPGEPAPIR